MPFYNIFVDWAEPLDETEQFNRLELVLVNTEHLIVGTTCLSTIRGRITFQTEKEVGAADFSVMIVAGAIRLILSPVRLGENGFPLLEMSSDAVEL